ncbi:MAG: polyisoprenoid-binding protein [Proteobacteria bacterium]|uniref:YceI family protein n=1 Tax=Rudaea sp. TaxID=2136325 RepID=UPI001E132B80|nr:polyisoprenoid-binding protein [Pseudomonadota bacterium]MBS0567621.1 polyisoprenoid-binding protein [Pseudomonadota bacterium]
MPIARAIAAIALAAPAVGSATPHDYRLDTVHTQVTASASHLGFSRPGGRLHVSGGWFRFDPDDWSTARVDVTIDATSIDFGNAAWNDKLRSREFLDVAHHPTARFVADKVEKTGDKTGVAHGKLTLLGLTRPLDLAITLHRIGVHAYTLKWTAGFAATATLKRSDFRMTKYLPDVGDEVSIGIEAEGIRDADARKSAADSSTASTEKTGEP